MSNKHHITIHHIKLFKPSKTKQEQLNILLTNWNKSIRAALKIVKHWDFTAYTKSHKHTYRVLRNNFNLPSQIAVEANRKAVETYKSADKKHRKQVKFHKTVAVSLVHNKGFKLIKHKADLKGITYQEVNPKYTSQVCSVCGEKGFRKSQNRFLCQELHLLNADYNASINIAKRAI